MKSNQLRNFFKNRWYYDVKVIVNDKEIEDDISTLAIIKENQIIFKIVNSQCRFSVSHLDFELKFDKNNSKISFEYDNQVYDNFNLVINDGLERVLVIC